MPPLTLRAPAKVNLHLRVFPARADGFHPLRSWFRTIDVFDELTFTRLDVPPPPSPPGTSVPQVDLRCADPRVPPGADNLIVRACRASCVTGDGATRPIRVDLDKRIPMGAGLGGGSSDAAAALVGAGRLSQDDRPTRPVRRRLALLDDARSLGSDVPFFLCHQLDGITDAVCTGRGDEVDPFRPARRHAVLLLLSDLHVPTPAVYKQFDRMPAPPDDGTPDFAAWSALSATDLLPRLRNDLEPPAFALYPALGDLRRAAERALARPVRMSGSGSALFTLYDDPAEADAAARRVRDLPVRPVPA